MLSNLKIKTRSFGNRIKQITLLGLVSTQKSIYGLEVLILKRDYSNSIEKKVNSEKVLLNKLISKETKKDFNFNENVNLNKKSSNLELNLIIKEKE